jgi:hypothetical protein
MISQGFTPNEKKSLVDGIELGRTGNVINGGGGVQNKT